MTATDVIMAKALVTLLNSEDFSNNATAIYAQGIELHLEEITKPAIYVAGTLDYRRIARAYWSQDVTLQVIAVGPQSQRGDPGVSATEDEKDAWLAFVDDELIASIKDTRVNQKLPASIQFQQRLDPVNLREKSLFFTQFQISFPLA